MAKPISFRATARVAQLASHAAVSLEILAIALGVGAFVIALALGTVPADGEVRGVELLTLGALLGCSAGLCWWLERRPSLRVAMWRVDGWFELDGALITAWEVEDGVVQSPSFRESLVDRVARVVVDRKEIGRAAFVLTLPIFLIPLAGAAALVGVQEERAENVAALEARNEGARGQDRGAASSNGGALANPGSEVEDPSLLPLASEVELDAAELLLEEIEQLEVLKEQLESAPQAEDTAGEQVLSPEEQAEFQLRIEERIAALRAALEGAAEDGKPVANPPEEGLGAEADGANPSNPATDGSSSVTNGPEQGRIRSFHGISPTGVWWPERQDGLVRSWLLRLEGGAGAAE